MTAPRWAGHSHAEITAMVAAGPGAAASAGAERAWRDAAGALSDVERELAAQGRSLPAGWSGPAAGGVRGGFDRLAAWSGTAATDAGRTADALAGQAALAAELRARVPAASGNGSPEAPPTGAAVLDDWAAADAAAGNAADRAAELMQRYEDDSRATGQPWTGWVPPPAVTSADPADASPAGGPDAGSRLPGPSADGGSGAAGTSNTGPDGRTAVAGSPGAGGIAAAVLTGTGATGIAGHRAIDVGSPAIPGALDTTAGHPAAAGPAGGPAERAAVTEPPPIGDHGRAGGGAPGTAGTNPAAPVGDGSGPGAGRLGGAAVIGGVAVGAVTVGGLVLGSAVLAARGTRAHSERRGRRRDGTGAGEPSTSGAEHRPPSGGALTSGTRGPSGPDPLAARTGDPHPGEPAHPVSESPTHHPAGTSGQAGATSAPPAFTTAPGASPEPFASGHLLVPPDAARPAPPTQGGTVPEGPVQAGVPHAAPGQGGPQPGPVQGQPVQAATAGPEGTVGPGAAGPLVPAAGPAVVPGTAPCVPGANGPAWRAVTDPARSEPAGSPPEEHRRPGESGPDRDDAVLRPDLRWRGRG
ncbi:hypothetical protein ACLFMI_08260 [Pseudonocardia nantongensis]|uniref:hypothetical protein n=1 Tax=Pseudonocardia nantongensis TaxID=1181885 RepID=UPI00397A07D0